MPTQKPIRDRAQINRENAKKSTGPKTQEGKDRVRFNATRHGLTGQVIVLPTDDLEAYAKHTSSFHEALQAKGTLEFHLVQTISDCMWQIHRSNAYHHQILSEKAIPRLHRYPETNNPQLNESFAVASVAAQCTKDLANFSMCHQRAYRSFEKALDRLMLMQEQRRAKEDAQMAEATQLLALHEAEEEERREAREVEAAKAAAASLPSPAPYIAVPYEPNKDGFGLQLFEIIAHRDRLERVDKAWKLPRYAAAA